MNSKWCAEEPAAACTAASAPASGIISRTLKHQCQTCTQLARRNCFSLWEAYSLICGTDVAFWGEIEKAALCTGVGETLLL